MKKSMLAFALFGAVTFASTPISAQITQNGPYYANPSWDQQIPTAQRFIVLSNWVDANFPSGGAAVLDRETGLVWERSPDPSAFTQWSPAFTVCRGRRTGNRLGWRLPSEEELASLLDATTLNLPAGSPFQVGFGENFFWTASTTRAPRASLGILVLAALAVSPLACRVRVRRRILLHGASAAARVLRCRPTSEAGRLLITLRAAKDRDGRALDLPHAREPCPRPASLRAGSLARVDRQALGSCERDQPQYCARARRAG